MRRWSTGAGASGETTAPEPMPSCDTACLMPASQHGPA